MKKVVLFVALAIAALAVIGATDRKRLPAPESISASDLAATVKRNAIEQMFWHERKITRNSADAVSIAGAIVNRSLLDWKDIVLACRFISQTETVIATQRITIYVASRAGTSAPFGPERLGVMPRGAARLECDPIDMTPM